MKSFFKKIVASYLAFLCRLRLNVKRPKIIGITGSYGKTSTKDAIAHLLSKKYKTYASKKSLNTEFGFALAILDLPSGYSNPFRWFMILLKATWRALFSPLPCDFLILEYGTDKPGDIGYLISTVKPDAGILTTVAPVHLESGQFPSVEAIFEEKKKLLTCLEKEDLAIFNGDLALFQNLKKELKTKVKTFGASPENDISVSALAADLNGISGSLCCQLLATNHKLNFHFPALGGHHIFIFLPALLVGEAYGIPIDEGVEFLQDFSFPPGRFSKLEGKRGSILLDSSYNASPKTMEAALQFLAEVPAKRKIAVLGSMNELGVQSERLHRDIGRIASKACEFLVTVGEQAKWISEEALSQGMAKERVKVFENSEETGGFLESFICKGDIVLFKGSQNRVRLEKAVAKVLADPSKARELLVRQEKEWEKI